MKIISPHLMQVLRKGPIRIPKANISSSKNELVFLSPDQIGGIKVLNTYFVDIYKKGPMFQKAIRYFDPDFNPESGVNRFNNTDHIAVVCKPSNSSRNEIVGCLDIHLSKSFFSHKKQAFFAIFVDPREQKKGVGKAMFWEVLRKSQTWDVESVAAKVSFCNTPCQRLMDPLCSSFKGIRVADSVNYHMGCYIYKIPVPKKSSPNFSL